METVGWVATRALLTELLSESVAQQMYRAVLDGSWEAHPLIQETP